MFEFKGKCRYGKRLTVIGAAGFAAAAVAFALLAVFTQAWIAALVFAVVGGSSAVVFLGGLNRILYSGKTVLKIYSDRLEFLNRDKLFARKFRAVNYGDIRKFKVGYHKRRNVSEESGSVWFIYGKKFCWIELENVSDGAWAVLARLRANQTDPSSEI